MAGSPVAPPRTLAEYASTLSGLDDEWRLRTLLHEFQLLWFDAPRGRRSQLVADQPSSVDERWDAFLAALAEHLCVADGIEPPAWTGEPERHLDHFWYPTIDSATLRVEATVHAPAAFESHGVLLAARELDVV